MCNLPVTFGGGIRITYGGRSEGCSGVNAPEASHLAYHFSSNEVGSKRVGNGSGRLTLPSAHLVVGESTTPYGSLSEQRGESHPVTRIRSQPFRAETLRAYLVRMTRSVLRDPLPLRFRKAW